MPNTLITNKLATAVAIRAAESAGYLTVGSRKYFAGQLADKNNGQTYAFYIRDTGDAVNRLEVEDGDKTTLTERKVELSLDPWHIFLSVNAIEKVTDIEDWEDEIAIVQGVKLVQGAVRKVINNDLGKCGAAFIGSGFTPLSQAIGHLGSVVSDELYGFSDPNTESILTSNGQQYVPVDAPDMYSKGLLGKFHECEMRSQRFFPVVSVSAALATAINAGKVTGAAASDESGVWNMTVSGFTAGIKIPKGFPLFIDGVKACDTVGDATSMDQAFVVLESVTTTGATAVVKVRAKDLVKGGTREIATEDGDSFAAAANVTGNTYGPEAGKYFMTQVRAQGAMEFETLDKIAAEGAEYEKSPNVENMIVHQNQLIDLKKMTNDVRWDIVTLAGIVDGRAVALAYCK